MTPMPPGDPSSRPVVVLACAEPDARRMTPVVRDLVRWGARVELVAGVETQVRPLEKALEVQGNRALYILCHSESLDRYQGDLLELTVRAGEVGPERLLSAWFSVDDPSDLFATIIRRLEQLRGPETPKASPESPSHPALGFVGASASVSSLPATTLVAARAALGYRRFWRALGLAVVVTVAVATTLYFALGSHVLASVGVGAQ